ncbi:MAG: hypothetical protein M0R80_00855 [Proteobacteria bacterium]|jgi:hypothetical protein|nr:hypothetical protein [Pseudomonadota bacterium]
MNIDEKTTYHTSTEWLLPFMRCVCPRCQQIAHDEIAGRLWLFGHSLPLAAPGKHAKIKITVEIEHAQVGDEDSVFQDGTKAGEVK